jgi:3-phenylpropionate/trans-cinnamate dioxygenase ferredoxin subunit
MADLNGWQRVANLADIKDGEALPAKFGADAIALYRLDGEVFAIGDVCTHEYALLSQGFVEDGAIECPLHQARFDIRTGRCLAAPATEDVKAYAVRIENGEVYVSLRT